MKIKKLSKGKLEAERVLLLISICLCLSTIIHAQTTNTQATNNDNKIPAPSEEEFKPADGIITLAPPVVRQNITTFDKDVVRFYNNDASIWYEFSNEQSHPLFMANTRKPSELKLFNPLWLVIFRLKAVSEHWYEVVINEETQETRYTLISNPVLGRVGFDRYLMPGPIVFDKEKNPFRDAPDGKIKDVVYRDNDQYLIDYIQKEWLLAHSSKTGETGWIRWKKDRDILIGYMLNDHQVPKQ